jgi:hypothetical protein
VKLAEIEAGWRAELADTWRGDPLAPFDLPSVKRCALGGATLVTWRRGHLGDPSEQFRLSCCFCKSWRCPRCAYGVAMQDLRRLQTGVLTRPWWLYCVLTIDPTQWANPWHVYRTAGHVWDKRLRKRLERRFGKLTYVQTWEAHRSGWPHLNLLLSGDALRDDVLSYPHGQRVAIKHGRERACHWTAWRSRRRGARGRFKGKRDTWTDWIEASGFGRMKWVEIVDSPAGVACYLAKVAREIGATLWKATGNGGDQRPLNAPPHFRRIRSSRALLPTAKAALRWDECQGWHEIQGASGQYEGVLVPTAIENIDPAAVTWSSLAPLLARRVLG